MGQAGILQQQKSQIAGGRHIESQTEARPPDGNSRVIDDQVMHEVERAVARQGDDYDPKSVYGLLLVCQQADFWRLRYDCSRISGLFGWHPQMPGQDGYSRAGSQLNVRAYAQGRSRGLPAPVRPVRHLSACYAIVIEGSFRSLSDHCALPASSNRKLGFIIRSVPEHRPGHPHGLVRQCYGGHIHVAAILELSGPTTQAILLPMGGTHR